METYEWLAEALSANEAQAGFYRELFKELWESKIGRVYNQDLPKEYSERSRQRWISRLCDGNKNQTGLEILKRKRDKSRGPVYYKWSEQIRGRLNHIWEVVKRGTA